MPKYTFEYLTKNKIAIAIKTKEEWKKVVGELLEWTVWYDGLKDMRFNLWVNWKDNSAIDLYDSRGEIGFSYLSYYQYQDFNIISAQEFLDDVNQPDETKEKPKKVRIIKEFEGLPLTGTILEFVQGNIVGNIYRSNNYRYYNILEIKLAIEAGYAEEVKEGRYKGKGYWKVATTGSTFQIVSCIDNMSLWDDRTYGENNYFETKEHAQLALEKIKEALKEVNKEINDNPTSN